MRWVRRWLWYTFICIILLASVIFGGMVVYYNHLVEGVLIILGSIVTFIMSTLITQHRHALVGSFDLGDLIGAWDDVDCFIDEPRLSTRATVSVYEYGVTISYKEGRITRTIELDGRDIDDIDYASDGDPLIVLRSSAFDSIFAVEDETDLDELFDALYSIEGWDD